MVEMVETIDFVASSEIRFRPMKQKTLNAIWGNQ